MIEVEKKVLLDERHIELIEKYAVFMKVDRFRDVYFDMDDFCLTKANVWLRHRESRYELKVGVSRQNSGAVDRFEEISDEAEIVNQLGLSGKLPEALSSAGILPFCSFTTERKKYVWDGIGIDLDDSNFGDFAYRVAEFELTVGVLSEVETAEKRIRELLGRLKVKEGIVPGKLIYYLREKRGVHYNALVEAKVIVFK